MEKKLDREHRLTAVEDRAKSNTRRIEDIEKRQDGLDELVSSVKTLAVREENVEKDVKEIKADVKEIASKPGKRWDGFWDKAIAAVASAVVAYALAKLGII